MHHMLYPISDVYISNKLTEKDKNFGIDEMLSIGVSHSYSKVLNNTKTYHYGNEYVAGIYFQNLTSIFTGSFYGFIQNSNGTIIGDLTRFSSSYFSGSVSGSLNGYETGSILTTTDFSGSLVGFSGSISSYTINGYVSSSIITECFREFKGILSSSMGTGSGYITGNDVRNEQNYTTEDERYIDRSLIKFDLSFISQSIVSGDITNPGFYLRLKSTEAHELPVSYKIYAFPVSQTWDQGDGYFSDGGSEYGISWNWRDYYSGSGWFYPTTEERITSSVDYLNDYSQVSQSFMRGGGTWFNIPCTQSFDYETSDINLNVTPIVNAWLSNSIPNYGIILMYSGEVSLTSSNTQMYFYSNQTNTIYNPKLDVAWNDQTWITGSFGTGSVEVLTFYPKLSGSVSSPVNITNVIASGSFIGNAYLVVNENNEVTTGSTINVTGKSESINGLNINGLILGTSSYDDTTKLRYITASLSSGDFTGCEIYAQYSSSVISGFLSGSFNEKLFLNGLISGSIPSNHIESSNVYLSSPVSMNLLGNISSGSLTGGLFNGVVIDGILKGANVSIPFTGSYSYITSSYSFTSSVEITGSFLQELNTEKPFVVIIQDLKKEYSFGDYPRIGVFGREHFPLKTFGKAPQQPTYITPKYLPTSSYYAIKDNETEEIIIDFDNYTKISCDETGNYFHLDTTSLCQERYYRVLIKVVDGNGNDYTFDANNVFKVRR